MSPNPWTRRVFRLPWRSAGQIRSEADEELRFHLDMRTEELERRGMSPEAARREARREFGDVDEARRRLRDADARREQVRRRAEWWDELRGDLRFALRALRRNPGFSATAVLTLALGIGAATAMFSVVNGVLLRPLPVQEQDRVLVAWLEHRERGEFMHIPVRYTNLREMEQQGGAFEGLAGVWYSGAWPKVMADRGQPLAPKQTWVTGDFFRVLGVTPALGRVLLPEDDVVGAPPVMVISYPFWQRQFGGDPSVIGHTLRWNDKNVTVVGVAPRGFDFPRGAEVWVPPVPIMPATLDESAGEDKAVLFDVVGRLRPGVTPEQARAELAAYMRRTDPERAEALRGLVPVVTPLSELIVGEVRPALLILSAAVALVLLLACVNVANLLLLRGSVRGQELAIRSALGAGRWRIARQLLVESGVLALLGGVLGALISVGAVRVLVALAPPELPRLESIQPDGRVFAFAAVVTLAAALLAGLAPAIWTAVGEPGASLRSGARVDPGGRRVRVVRQALVVGQVALALLVLAGAGLLIRSLYELQRVEMGFAKDHLLIVRTHLPPERSGTREQKLARLDRVLSEVGAVPGVRAVTSVAAGPFSGTGGVDALYTGEGQSEGERAMNPWANLEMVGPGHFRTMGIPIRRGRGFTEQDREEAAPVAVVSEALAEHTWPGADPIGQRIKIGGPETPQPWRTVVGIVPETRYRELVTPRPTLYLPYTQFGGPWVPVNLVLRTYINPAAVIPAVRSALREIDPELVVTDARSMHEHLAAPLARPRFSAVLLGMLAAIAVLLAAVGIYGVMAAFVRQRTHEIGVRLALGARTGDIRGMILRQGMLLLFLGTAIGIVAALAGTRVLAAILFEISPTDPATLAAAAGALILVGVAAFYLPVRRATRVDPMVALRAE
jgi:putative ABC transport system permease protein